MHIKFTKHGKGCPRKAVGYLLAEKDAKGDLRPDIQTLRGDAKTFVSIVESLNFDYRYSSAVIAWSKEDNPTDAQIQETLDQFEKHAFADLDPTRYHMNAVLHVAQDGSKHVHVLIPRVDLGTGKSLNIAPPGHEKYFDKLRDYLNEKHCWSKPDDLAILKADVQLPHHTHSQRLAAIEINFSGKTKPEKKELLNKIVAQRINAGVIQDRTDVVQTLAEYGI
ncbi:relaxase/mobilization nuclease domain-containing protein, partial [Acinetobacter sp. YH12058]|uniref:relaxase/mobilization nuclease domain-containing protein n=1 Tax=Acinetobacter sp. YH12058 TaxID=2601058 RepID=UPI0015D2EF65